MECSSGPANIRNRMGSMGRRVAAAALLLAQVWSARGSSCREELTPETNSTGLGRCVAACINLAAVQAAIRCSSRHRCGVDSRKRHTRRGGKGLYLRCPVQVEQRYPRDSGCAGVVGGTETAAIGSVLSRCLL
jgi:hypothetical protein